MSVYTSYIYLPYINWNEQTLMLVEYGLLCVSFIVVGWNGFFKIMAVYSHIQKTTPVLLYYLAGFYRLHNCILICFLSSNYNEMQQHSITYKDRESLMTRLKVKVSTSPVLKDSEPERSRIKIQVSIFRPPECLLVLLRHFQVTREMMSQYSLCATILMFDIFSLEAIYKIIEVIFVF